MKKRTDILARLMGLVLVTIGIDYIMKMDWLPAIFYIGAGFSISIAPVFYKDR